MYMVGQVLQALADGGVRLIAMRCTGYNNVDLHAAAQVRIMMMIVCRFTHKILKFDNDHMPFTHKIL